MILETLELDRDAFAQRTGWELKPEGACKGEVCVPLTAGTSSSGSVDVQLLAERLGMPLVRDEAHDVWALGPDTGVTGRALTTAVAPELVLQDLRTDKAFALSSLRGQKVLLVAWASW